MLSISLKGGFISPTSAAQTRIQEMPTPELFLIQMFGSCIRKKHVLCCTLE